MKPYYQDAWVTQYCSDSLKVLPEIPSSSVDLLVTDPPYGIGFMGKDWDKALPDKAIWAECLRVLKPGSFAFVMSIPRADCLSRMIIALEDAGFLVNFTPIFWAYASGFPKAQNVSKQADKRLGVEREIVGSRHTRAGITNTNIFTNKIPDVNISVPATPQAKALDGSYGGFQPKPAVEVIIVAMKPLSEKTFVDQALKNRKGITWLDDGRIPYESEGDKEGARFGTQMDIRGGNLKTPIGIKGRNVLSSQSGRFPANLLVSDDVLNDGRVTLSRGGNSRQINVDSGRYNWNKPNSKHDKPDGIDPGYGDSGSFSRYFDLDKWWFHQMLKLPESVKKTFPFLIVPKASKREKNKGCEGLPEVPVSINEPHNSKNLEERYAMKARNYHPTVKPLKLMSYLITLGSRAGDTVLDPFMGSGTTGIACQLLNRKFIGMEIEEKYCEIAANRCRQKVFDLTL